jgi:hypothetical protein
MPLGFTLFSPTCITAVSPRVTDFGFCLQAAQAAPE